MDEFKETEASYRSYLQQKTVPPARPKIDWRIEIPAWLLVLGVIAFAWWIVHAWR